jgi:hypothetical protein
MTSNVLRFGCLPPRHVLRRRNDADHVELWFQLRDRVHRRNHTGATGHVVLHVLHSLGGFDRDAARIERDSFSDECEQLFARRVARVTHHDELRGLRTALRHGEKRAHSFATRSRLIEDVDLESILLGDFRRLFGQARRRHQVGRRNR